MCANVEIPRKCICGPNSHICPACKALREQGTQLDSEEAALEYPGVSNPTLAEAGMVSIAGRRKKWKKTCNEYFQLIKERQKESGRLGLHKKELLPWREEMELFTKEDFDE